MTVRVIADDAGTFTVYVLDPFDAGQALHHVAGVSAQLTARDERELRWAADRSGVVSARDLLRETRTALREATHSTGTRPRSTRARETTDAAPPSTPRPRRAPASGQPVAKALRRRKEKPDD